MSINLPLKSFKWDHSSNEAALVFRLRLIAETIHLKKNECFWRALVLKVLKQLPHNLPREYYDIETCRLLYQWIRARVPFRKDSYNVETIQYPEITLEYGGDCDCQVVLSAVLILNSGVDCKIVLSKQGAAGFNHIALFIPSVGKVFDLTSPYGFPMDLFKLTDPAVLEINLNSNQGRCNG